MDHVYADHGVIVGVGQSGEANDDEQWAVINMGPDVGSVVSKHPTRTAAWESAYALRTIEQERRPR